jgi:hypothetical protein
MAHVELEAAAKTELEAALSAACRAALPLPAKERPAFVSEHLIAQADRTNPPVLSSEHTRIGTAAELRAELTALSELLTAAVRSARGKPGWPLRAVAAALASGGDAPPPESAPSGRAEEELGRAVAAEAPPPSAAVAAAAAEPAAAPAVTAPPTKQTSFAEPDPAAGGGGAGRAGSATAGGKAAAEGEDVHDAFRVSQGGMVRMKTFRESVESVEGLLELQSSDESAHVRQVATLAFEMYDKDGSGSIDKDEVTERGLNARLCALVLLSD